MFLDATTKSLEIKLGGAVTTNQLPVAVSYVDISQSTFAVSAMSSTDTQSNGATAVTIVAAPGATTTRVPKRIWVRNADTVSATVTIQLNNTATALRPEVVFTLLTGETLIYEDAAGWMAFDVNGNRKEVTSSVFSSLTVTGASTLAAVTASGLGTFNAGISLPNANITGSGTAAITGFASASLGAISGTTGAFSDNLTLSGAAKNLYLTGTGTTSIDFNNGTQHFALYGSIAVPGLGTISSHDIYLFTANTERLRITSAGVVRITNVPAFAAGDKYLVIDASGNIHVSALGPAS